MIDKYQFLDAAKSGDSKLVEQYLSEEQNINLVDDRSDAHGETALIYAAKNNQLKIVKLLTEFPLDTGIVDKTLNSALHYAIKNKNLKIFKLIAESTKEWGSYSVGDETVPYEYFDMILINMFIDNEYEPIKILLKCRYDVKVNANIDLIFSHCLQVGDRKLIDFLIKESSYKFLANSEDAFTDLGDPNDGISFYKVEHESINKMALKIEIVETNSHQPQKSAEAFIINSLSNIISSLISHKKHIENAAICPAACVNVEDMKNNFIALTTLASLLVESKYFDPRTSDINIVDEYKFDDDDQFDREHDDEVYFDKNEAIKNLITFCESYDKFLDKILKQIKLKQSQLYAIEFLGNFLDKFSNGFKKNDYKKLLDVFSKYNNAERLDMLIKGYKYLNPHNKKRLNIVEVIYYVNEYFNGIIKEYIDLKKQYKNHNDEMFKGMFDESVLTDTLHFVRERFK